MSDDAKRTKRIEMKFPQRRTLHLGFYIPREQFGLAQRELCGGRARPARLRITYRCTVTQRPCSGTAWDSERMVNNNCASLIFLYGNGFQQWVRRSARRPHQSMCRDFTVAEDYHARVCVGQARVQAKGDTSALHPFLCIMGERFAKLWQDALPRVHHNDAYLFRMQARIIGEDPASKIVQRPCEFDACKSSSRNYKS